MIFLKPSSITFSAKKRTPLFVGEGRGYNHLQTIQQNNCVKVISYLSIGVRDQFRSGAEISYLNMFSIACPKIKWFCPNIISFFAKKLPFEKL